MIDEQIPSGSARFQERMRIKAEQATRDAQRMQEKRSAIQYARDIGSVEKEAHVREIRRQYIRHQPKNAEELHQAVRAIYGLSIPYTSTQENFNAPFEWYATVYFGTKEDTVALASRGGGKTLQASSLSDILCSHSPVFESIHAGGTKVQATVASKYLNQFYSIEELKGGFKERPATYSAKWKNGSLWEIVTGSMKGVSGQHPIMLTLDEIEFWDREALQQTFEVPVNKETRYGFYKRRWSAFSTRQRSYGAMNWLVEEAPKRGFKFFQWTVFETMRPCHTCIALDQEPFGDDDAREKVCVLWQACRGVRARKATGWVKLEDAQAKCIRLGGPRGREWLTQGLCTRPSSHGLVLHNFEKRLRPDGNLTRWEYEPMLPWYAVHDPAAGKKSVILLFQIHDGCIFVFDEVVDPLCSSTMEAKQAFYDHCERMGYPDPAMIIVDPHRTDSVSDWRRGSRSGTGILKKYKATTPDISKYSGTGQELKKTIDLLRQYIHDGAYKRRLFVNKDFCTSLYTSIGEYHYPTDDATNEIISDAPVVDQYEDDIDALRYLVMWFIGKFLKGRIGEGDLVVL